MPPTLGAAMRRITFAPVPVPYMMGNRPAKMVATVMIFGRRRSRAPSVTASWTSSMVTARPSAAAYRRRLSSAMLR